MKRAYTINTKSRADNLNVQKALELSFTLRDIHRDFTFPTDPTHEWDTYESTMTVEVSSADEHYLDHVIAKASTLFHKIAIIKES